MDCLLAGQPRQALRGTLVQRLYQYEDSYHSRMLFLQNTYLKPLEHDRNLLTPKEYELIFNNVSELVALSEAVWRALTDEMERAKTSEGGPGGAAVGAIFCDLVGPKLHVVEGYCFRFYAETEQVFIHCKARKAFAEFLCTQKSTYLDIPDLLGLLRL
eukprot:RCo013909